MTGGWEIYGLRLPRGPIRYVGSTQSGLHGRLEQHRQRARARPETRLHRWMARVGPYRVEAVLLETVTEGDVDALDAAETRWITEHRERGGYLLNMNGGGSGSSHDPPAQAARRAKVAGSRHWNYGRTVPAETRARISESLRARAAAGVATSRELSTQGRAVLSATAALTNHLRWHEARGIQKPDCGHCPLAPATQPAHSPGEPTKERSTT